MDDIASHFTVRGKSGYGAGISMKDGLVELTGAIEAHRERHGHVDQHTGRGRLQTCFRRIYLHVTAKSRAS